MGMIVTCPFCESALPLRRDKRGGRYFRCNQCQLACFFSGRTVIDRLDEGGTWSITIEQEPPLPGVLELLLGK